MPEFPQRPARPATPQDKMMATLEGREALWQAEMIRRKPEVKSYDQSWRDRIATSLIGAGMPEKTVEGLLASRGMGISENAPMGMGLIDFTPFAIPLWLNEAERARSAGDMGGQMLNTVAAVPIPGAKIAAKAVGEGVEAAQQGIRAYHGSPHDFDKFDMSKIGTGEGAQAYGHGLYFAEREGTAKSYRDALTFHPEPGSTDETADWLLREGGESMEGVEVYAKSWTDKTDEEIEALINATGGVDVPSLEDAIDNIQAEKKAVRLALERLRTGWRPPRGRMYETRINASPDEFLDWDKPLSEQPESAKKAIDALARKFGMTNDDGSLANWASPEDFYNHLAGEFGGERMLGAGDKQWGPVPYPDEAKATEVLREAGIKGIRYLDQGSRGKGEGTANFVVFDDSIIEILRKYGIAGLLGGGAAASLSIDDATAAVKKPRPKTILEKAVR